MVKISEQLFERLMDRYVAVGTMEQLSSSYENKISTMQATIDKLNTGMKKLKNRIQEYEKFIDFKGITEMFKEFVRPKTLTEQLEEKKIIEEMKKSQTISDTRKNMMLL